MDRSGLDRLLSLSVVDSRFGHGECLQRQAFRELLRRRASSSHRPIVHRLRRAARHRRLSRYDHRNRLDLALDARLRRSRHRTGDENASRRKTSTDGLGARRSPRASLTARHRSRRPSRQHAKFLPVDARPSLLTRVDRLADRRTPPVDALPPCCACSGRIRRATSDAETLRRLQPNPACRTSSNWRDSRRPAEPRRRVGRLPRHQGSQSARRRVYDVGFASGRARSAVHREGLRRNAYRPSHEGFAGAVLRSSRASVDDRCRRPRRHRCHRPRVHPAHYRLRSERADAAPHHAPRIRRDDSCCAWSRSRSGVHVRGDGVSDRRSRSAFLQRDGIGRARASLAGRVIADGRERRRSAPRRRSPCPVAFGPRASRSSHDVWLVRDGLCG